MMKGSQEPERKLKSMDDAEKEEAEGKALAEDILAHGKDHPLDMSPVTLPSWCDEDLVRDGQRYFCKNRFNMFVAKLSGLLALLSSPTIVKVLHKTDKSSIPVTAYKRYMGTINYMRLWYETDMMDPKSEGRQSIVIVRAFHSAAFKSAGPITQLDLALTQFGFIGVALISAKELGLPPDQVGLAHFWRVIGHLMGIQDRFNLFRGSLRSSIAACEVLASRYFTQHLDSPPEEFSLMSYALLDGMWPVIVFFSPVAFMEHTRRLVGCPPKKLSCLPNFFLSAEMLVHRLSQTPIVSFFLVPFLNFTMWFTIFVQNTLPVIAFCKFGRAICRD